MTYNNIHINNFGSSNQFLLALLVKCFYSIFSKIKFFLWCKKENFLLYIHTFKFFLIPYNLDTKVKKIYSIFSVFFINISDYIYLVFHLFDPQIFSIFNQKN